MRRVALDFWGTAVCLHVQESDADHFDYYLGRHRSAVRRRCDAAICVSLQAVGAPSFIGAIGTDVVKEIHVRHPGDQAWTLYERFTTRAAKPTPIPPYPFLPADTWLEHACTVARDGQALLIAGPSASGKSVLGLSLCEQGFALVCDDIAVGRGNEVFPYHRPIGVRSGSLRLLPDAWAAAIPVVSLALRTATGTTYMVRAADIGIPTVDGPVTVAGRVTLQRADVFGAEHGPGALHLLWDPQRHLDEARHAVTSLWDAASPPQELVP
jgi:hypothetical protein